MAASFFIIGKEFKEASELEKSIRTCANNLGLLFNDQSTKEVLEYKLNTPDFENSVSLYPKGKETFDRKIEFEDDIKDYSITVSLWNNFGNDIVIPFLQEFFKIYPDMRLYNADFSKENEPPLVYDKAYLDKFDGTGEDWWPYLVDKTKVVV